MELITSCRDENFPSGYFHELCSRVTVSEIVRRKVILKSNGAEHSGLCPFHKEKSPSFTVNDKKGFYHCFGCGAHGNVIDFIMMTEGFDNFDATEKLANEIGFSVDDFNKERVALVMIQAKQAETERKEYIECFKKYILLPSCKVETMLLFLSGSRPNAPQGTMFHDKQIYDFIVSALNIDDIPIAKKGASDLGYDSLVRPKIFLKWCIDSNAPIADDIRKLVIDALGNTATIIKTDSSTYTTPYLELMKEAIAEFKISADCQPKVKEELVPWFSAKLTAIEGNKGVENKAKLMATFVRLPESAKGGVKKFNRNNN